jgi:hypothetical protein
MSASLTAVYLALATILAPSIASANCLGPAVVRPDGTILCTAPATRYDIELLKKQLDSIETIVRCIGQRTGAVCTAPYTDPSK